VSGEISANGEEEERPEQQPKGSAAGIVALVERDQPGNEHECRGVCRQIGRDALQEQIVINPMFTAHASTA